MDNIDQWLRRYVSDIFPDGFELNELVHRRERDRQYVTVNWRIPEPERPNRYALPILCQIEPSVFHALDHANEKELDRIGKGINRQLRHLLTGYDAKAPPGESFLVIIDDHALDLI